MLTIHVWPRRLKEFLLTHPLMNTLLLHAEAAGTAQTAADIIRQGGLVAIPTETVYGLGADGLNPAAVAKIFAAKGRPQDNPLILHVAEPKDMEKFCHSIPRSAYLLAEAFWPGPLTMVLPARNCVPKCTTAGLPTVAVRCPDNAVTREIIRLSGIPIAAPSANISPSSHKLQVSTETGSYAPCHWRAPEILNPQHPP